MQNFPIVTAFRIDFEYFGPRMAKVKPCHSPGVHYYTCIIFKSNIVKINYDGFRWIETELGESNPLSSALGKGIEKYMKRLLKGDAM